MCSPIISCVWSPTPDTHCDTSLNECGGEEADDDDNLAYRKLLVSLSFIHCLSLPKSSLLINF